MNYDIPISYSIYTDGGSRGNPGKSASGVYISDVHGTTIAELSEYLGIQTNNYAEYYGLKLGLLKGIELGINKSKIELFMDSKLVVEQVNGNWRINNENLKKLHSEVLSILKEYTNIKISHIIRKYNKKADELVNKSINNFQK